MNEQASNTGPTGDMGETAMIPPLPDEAREDTPTGGRHPVNVGHLVMGLAFTGLLVIWALVASDTVPNDDIRWLLPVPWLLGGGVGLVAVLVSQTRNQRKGR
jgi:hypothetical protein